MTGSASFVPEDFTSKELQLLKAVVPTAQRIAILVNPKNPTHQLELTKLPETARRYGPNALDQWRGGAAYVDKILKGAKPAELPVTQPTRYSLVINLKTAKALGLTIPPDVLAQASELLE